VVLEDDHTVLVKQRRAGDAVERIQRPQILMPDLFAVEVHGQHPMIPEVGVDSFVVCSRCARGITVLRVSGRLRTSVRSKSLPKLQPICASEAQNRLLAAVVVRRR